MKFLREAIAEELTVAKVRQWLYDNAETIVPESAISINGNKVDFAVGLLISYIGYLSKCPFKIGKVNGEFSIQEIEGFEDIASIIPEEVTGTFVLRLMNASFDDLVRLVPKTADSIIIKVSSLGSLKGCPTNILGDFQIHETALGSLAGGPKSVGGDFILRYCSLTSVKGSPREVGGDFIISGSHNTKLENLEGSPREIGGDFEVLSSGLQSLKGMTQNIGHSVYVGSNHLTNLEGAPKKINGTFNCVSNYLTSLKGAPKHIERDFMCLSQPWLKSHEGMPEYIGGRKLVAAIKE